MKTTKCTHPNCKNEAVVWYRWTDLFEGQVFEMVCNEHARLIREHVSVFDSRGVMHNGIAEGAGR